MQPRLPATRRMLATVVGLCGLTLVAAYLNKARCAGAPFGEDGRSIIFDRIKDTQVCYSDIQFLWLGRGIDQHLFPYLHGSITPDGVLVGGSVEYPVLSGVLMWLGAVGANDDAQFLAQTALLLAPFGLLTAWLLGRLAGWSALLWSVGSPLVLYAFHNWELPVVAASVGAIYVVTALPRWPLRRRAVLAAVLLGIGFCLKIYPGMFVLPLVLFVLTGGVAGRELPASVTGRYDIRGAIGVAAAAVVTVVAINLPFAVAGFAGWRASITFQQQRAADITTNSIWYWGLRPLFGPGAGNPATGNLGAGTTAAENAAAYEHAVSVTSPVLILLSFGLAAWLGWRRHQRTGGYPWVQVSGAMLCGFLLFHKVHSPQYTLWIVPFLVLVAVPWPAVAGYLVADVAVGVWVFRYFYALSNDGSVVVVENVVQFGVWARAALLVVFYVLFLRGELRSGPARPDRSVPTPGPVTARDGRLVPAVG
ncbi:glycosyltransferase family 87 protein [Skermania piniformis]|uniref:DUF2029 domain-containing protein n=1 Tax=Skermania pinensis TaxID=39122 RepID=A0ABX8SAU7_9ACTN|nr:hypothetical protein [Skermania piniformis]QXQ13685.1 hypothetical protein KV203_18115 [Skermania piniformis]